MGRWGEEEKKSQGLFGCFFAVGIFGLFCYTFYVNYQNLEGRRALEKKMQDIVRQGHRKSESQMIGDILHEAQQLGFPLAAEDIELTKRSDGMTNYIVDVYIAFPFDIDLLVTSFNMDMPISESVHLVIW